ncbi:hypothetical protein [Wenjunlia vitaminophila]|uniref:hypothetical protein n=1 Tax=Wenjunlia vitaminophila TaxID=76728 RepID=UPI00036D0FA3|nr:hypothetical protein [Wenjunlia vitaminophila]
MDPQRTQDPQLPDSRLPRLAVALADADRAVRNPISRRLRETTTVGQAEAATAAAEDRDPTPAGLTTRGLAALNRLQAALGLGAAA